MTILPWADCLNTGRCTYCLTRDLRDNCPAGSTCRICGGLLTRAQDELVPYDKAKDDKARGLGDERRRLYEDALSGTPAGDKKTIRAKSQDPKHYGPD
eukprot:16442776-Heterocapsa_arctica.AAC.1